MTAMLNQLENGRDGGIRTHTVHALNVSPAANWATSPLKIILCSLSPHAHVEGCRTDRTCPIQPNDVLQSPPQRQTNRTSPRQSRRQNAHL